MTLPQDSLTPDQPIIPDDSIAPGEPVQLPAARRRRARRTLTLIGDDERNHFLGNLGRRAFPAFEFFLFSLLCGAILGAGYLLDSHSLLLLGILLAPLMTPWVGFTLAAVTGSWRFFFHTLAGLLLGGLLIFFGGSLAGLAARAGTTFSMTQASTQSHLWWPNLIVLALGAVLLVASFVRSEEKPILASVMVAYELYLPLSAAGYGLGRGASTIWPNGLYVFILHFSLAVLLGMLTLFVLRFHPRRILAYALPVLVGLVGLGAIFFLSGLANMLTGFFSTRPVVLPTFTPAPAATLVWTPTGSPAARPSATQKPAVATITPTLNIPPTSTPSRVSTARPTPVYARISASSGDGAIVYLEPGGGVVVTSLINEYLVEILPDPVEVNGVTWMHVRTADGIEGWIRDSLLSLATPIPGTTP